MQHTHIFLFLWKVLGGKLEMTEQWPVEESVGNFGRFTIAAPFSMAITEVDIRL